MYNLHTPHQFKTRPARLGMGIVGLVLAYLLITRAFDTGSYWEYLGTLVLAVLGIRLIVKAFKAKK
ncbi:MAG TPA: hypothetical protein VLF87_01575 [Patescibacteria group bacterium]|nr:hypothetical protein [Patescibacteria group bacterium]